MKELKKEDLGLLITVSGLMDVVDGCCHNIGLHRNTVNMSLGIYGKTERLVDEDIREITTLWTWNGNRRFSSKNMVERIMKGNLTPEKASVQLALLCICGIYNTERSADILRRMSEK